MVGICSDDDCDVESVLVHVCFCSRGSGLLINFVVVFFFFCFNKAQGEHEALWELSHSRVYRVCDACMNDGLVWQAEPENMSC